MRTSTRATAAQARVELLLTLRRGESLLVSFLIPVGILVFFTKVDAVNTSIRRPGRLPRSRRARAGRDVDGDGEPRHRDRLRAPLRRAEATGLDAVVARRVARAKTVNVLAIEVLQAIVIIATGLALGWEVTTGIGLAIVLLLLGTIAFAGIGMLMAGHAARRGEPRGRERAVPGVAVPRRDGLPAAPTPGCAPDVRRALPAAALSESVRAALAGARVPVGQRRRPARVGDRRPVRRRSATSAGRRS